MRKTNRLVPIIFIILIFLSTAYIFGNSLQNGRVSNERSEGIVEEIKPIIDRNDSISSDELNEYIRKLAHMMEFALLGLSLVGAMLSLCGTTGSCHIGLMLFWSLATAVCDEFIQSFTGRTSSVKDVIIDFGGSLVGMLVAYVGYILLRKLIKRREKARGKRAT